VRYRQTLSTAILAVAMMLAGFLIARLHLHLFDRLFLWQGKVPRVLGRRERARGQAPAGAS
jgi:hypothetical protein